MEDGQVVRQRGGVFLVDNGDDTDDMAKMRDVSGKQRGREFYCGNNGGNGNDNGSGSGSDDYDDRAASWRLGMSRLMQFGGGLMIVL